MRDLSHLPGFTFHLSLSFFYLSRRSVLAVPIQVRIEFGSLFSFHVQLPIQLMLSQPLDSTRFVSTPLRPVAHYPFCLTVTLFIETTPFSSTRLVSTHHLICLFQNVLALFNPTRFCSTPLCMQGYDNKPLAVICAVNKRASDQNSLFSPRPGVAVFTAEDQNLLVALSTTAASVLHQAKL